MAPFPEELIVSHVKTGKLYMIVIGPDSLRIEKTGEPGYAYRAVFGDQMIWVRSQTEMEDGRFVAAPPSGPARPRLVKG